MKLNKDILLNIAEKVTSNERRSARLEDYKKFLMFNGQTKEIVLEAMKQDFKKPETIKELQSRIISINILGKIITKQAGVYVEAPDRQVVDENTRDQMLLESYVEAMELNQRMKESNKYFKLFKRNLMELYVDEKGKPRVRSLPRHTYEVFSHSKISPNTPDTFVKILVDDYDSEKIVMAVWTDESFAIVNGKGQIDVRAMIELENPELTNDYGIAPFIYSNECSYAVDPIQDDDLTQCCLSILILLTDLCYAQKYNSWGILYSVGDIGDVPVNPNSMINLQFGPEGEVPSINTVKPDVDTEKVVMLIKTILAMLLSTKNLSTTTVRSDIDASDVASGISKMLDSAESIEDKKDQQAYFNKAEYDLWTMLSNYLVPVWRKQNKLAPKYNMEFSRDMEVSIGFQEPKVMVTDREKVELAKMRLDADLSTLEQELTYIYPQKNAEQIEILLEEILAGKMSTIAKFVADQESFEEIDEESPEDQMDDGQV